MILVVGYVNSQALSRFCIAILKWWVLKLILIDIAAWYATRREWCFIRKGMFSHTETNQFLFISYDVECKHVVILS